MRIGVGSEHEYFLAQYPHPFGHEHFLTLEHKVCNRCFDMDTHSFDDAYISMSYMTRYVSSFHLKLLVSFKVLHKFISNINLSCLDSFAQL